MILDLLVVIAICVVVIALRGRKPKAPLPRTRRTIERSMEQTARGIEQGEQRIRDSQRLHEQAMRDIARTEQEIRDTEQAMRERAGGL